VDLPDTFTLLLLAAGLGVLLVAVGVVAFAIRELRREAQERRRLYTRHRRVE
jgi:CHASE3 domain sensor protein